MASTLFQEAFRQALMQASPPAPRHSLVRASAAILAGAAVGVVLAGGTLLRDQLPALEWLGLAFALVCAARFGLPSLAGLALGLLTLWPVDPALQVLGAARIELGLSAVALVALAVRHHYLARSQDLQARTREGQGHRHQLLNALLASNQDALGLFDRSGRLLALNPAGRAQMHLPPEPNELQSSWLSWWPQAQQTEARLRFEAALAGESQRFEAESPAGGEQLRRWDIQLLPVRGPKGEPVAVLSIWRDITPTARALQEARDAGAAYAELLRRIDDAFLALDEDWQVVFANKEADETLHSDSGTLTGRNLWQLFPELNGSEFQTLCLESLHDGQSRRLQYYLARHETWLNVAIYPSERGVALLLRDVTEQVRAAAQIERHRARLRLAQDIAGFGDWEFDAVHGRFELGELACRLLSVSPEDAAKDGRRALLDAVDDSERGDVLAHLLSRIAARRPIDVRFRTRGPAPRQLRLRGQIMADESGRPRHVVGTLHDITEAMQRLDAAHRDSAFSRAVIDALPQNICVVDASGRIVSTNRGWDEFALGSGADPARTGVGANYLEVCQGAAELPEAGEFLRGFRELVAGRQQRHVQRYAMGHDEHGRVHWFEVQVLPLQLEAERRLFLIRHEDIAEHLEVAQRLHESEQRFRELAEFLPETFFVLDPDRGVFEYLSPGHARLPGMLSGLVIERPEQLAEALTPESRQRWLDLLAAPGWFEDSGLLSLSVRTDDGRAAAIDLHFSPVRDAGGGIRHVVGLMVDVSERQFQAERLRSVSLQDSLTELPNRLALLQAMEARLHEAPGRDLALLLLNIDGLMAINDSFGHPFGDSLLAAFARRLKECVGGRCLLARIGGDEFAVLAEDGLSPAQLAELVARLEAHLRAPFAIGGEELLITASAGSARCPQDATDPADLLRRADLALHAAKREGRGHHVAFGEDVGAPSAELVRMKNDLQRALERGEFELVFQPKYSVEALEVTGIEALLRWRRRGEQQVSPAEFIPLLEESGGIVAVGAWVLHQACAAAQRLRTCGMPQLSIAVNVSARQMQDARIVSEVVSALTDTALPPAALELEITESALMRDPEQVVALTRELRRLGVKIALDDFGTRYSSLNYLRQFAPQVLKIDKSFVDEIDTDARAAATVRAIIELGRNLDMHLVAEGVERDTQLELLRGLGCHEVQGYLLMRPVPLDVLEHALQQSSAARIAAAPG